MVRAPRGRGHAAPEVSSGWANGGTWIPEIYHENDARGSDRGGRPGGLRDAWALGLRRGLRQGYEDHPPAPGNPAGDAGPRRRRDGAGRLLVYDPTRR